MFKKVILSDNQPCKVRVLGLFELDGVGRDVLGPYRYSLLMATGEVLEDEYDLQFIQEVPKKPDIPEDEIEQGSYEWHQLKEWETYQAALAHEKLRQESYEGYLSDIAQYILNNCLDENDRNRVIEPEDWHKIQSAAIVPRITEEAIADTLRSTFQGII